MSQRYTAKLRVVLDFDVDEVWNEDCTINQIVKQAKESGLIHLRNALNHIEKPYNAPHIFSSQVIQVAIVEEVRKL